MWLWRPLPLRWRLSVAAPACVAAVWWLETCGELCRPVDARITRAAVTAFVALLRHVRNRGMLGATSRLGFVASCSPSCYLRAQLLAQYSTHLEQAVEALRAHENSTQVRGGGKVRTSRIVLCTPHKSHQRAGTHVCAIARRCMNARVTNGIIFNVHTHAHTCDRHCHADIVTLTHPQLRTHINALTHPHARPPVSVRSHCRNEPSLHCGW